MQATSSIKLGLKWLGFAAGAAATGYGAYAGATWLRYGRAKDRASSQEADPLLDRFMPIYDVSERRHTPVGAPAAITLAAACAMDLQQSAIIRAIFRAREMALGGTPNQSAAPQSLLGQVTALGWGILAEAGGREIVFGAVTQPWAADVVFHALPAEEFTAFSKPGYVKIAWTLRADPVDSGRSVFRTETRAAATDPQARSQFRLYWSLVSPGVKLIRLFLLGIVKHEAERRARRAEYTHAAELHAVR